MLKILSEHFELIVFTINGAMAVLMALLFLTGRANKATGSRRSSPTHKRCAWMLLILTVILVVLIRVHVVVNGGLAKTDLLFWVHLSFASSFLITLISMTFVATGERSRYHAIGFSLLLSFFIGMTILGIPVTHRSAHPSHRPIERTPPSVRFFIFYYQCSPKGTARPDSGTVST